MTRVSPARLVLLGHPVAHSLSPVMHNAALRAAGIALTYSTRDVEPADLARVLGELTAERGAGNVTTPHKEAVFGLCARLAPTARRVGAVNTFWVESGALVGDNTDVEGFERAVVRLRGAAPAHATIGVLGAGGAAAAVLAAVADWTNCTTRVWNRTRARAEGLADRFPGVRVAPTPAAAVSGSALVVNATTIGLSPRDGHQMPVDPALIPRDADVIDLVYRPGETEWVRAARARGHRSCDGLPMLIEQGALAFERWFGIPPDREAMETAVRGSGETPSHDGPPE